MPFATRRTGFAGLGEPPERPGVVRTIFRNTERMHPDNCCPQCQTTDPITRKMVRVPLGVGAFGTGKNVMELQFQLTGHRRGIEYDIKRLKRKSTWERVGGRWSRLEFVSTETHDDTGNDDECLEPKNGSIFSMDAPGFPRLLPQPYGMRIGVSGGGASSVDASDIVIRGSFVEFAMARDKARPGAPWFPISACICWHNVTWLTRNPANEWVLDRNRSRIGRGSLPNPALDSPPGP